MVLSISCAESSHKAEAILAGETLLFLAFQIPAWALAISVTGGANSIELAFVAVALNKVAIFTSKSPLDETWMKWSKGFLFAIATAVQVILMNSGLEEPDNVDECVQKCPHSHCRIGVSIISTIIPTAAGNLTRSNSSWPDRTTLPTERVAGWLVLDREDSCAHELMLSGTQRGLFKAWTVIMSLGGFCVLLMILSLPNKKPGANNHMPPLHGAEVTGVVGHAE